MILKMTNVLWRLNKAKSITKRPAVLKNTPLNRLLAKSSEPKDNSANTGKVPKANMSIAREPVKKLPDESATICIDCVKPQGRKK